LRNSETGGLRVYNIANNQITGTALLGTVGLEWQFAGVAQVNAPGVKLESRSANSRRFLTVMPLSIPQRA
jgi:hypothetical protein